MGKKGAGRHPPVGGRHPSEMNKSDNEQKRSSVFQDKINRGDVNSGRRAVMTKKVASFFQEK